MDGACGRHCRPVRYASLSAAAAIVIVTSGVTSGGIVGVTSGGIVFVTSGVVANVTSGVIVSVTSGGIVSVTSGRGFSKRSGTDTCTGSTSGYSCRRGFAGRP